MESLPKSFSVLLLAGDPPSDELLLELSRRADSVFAADSACEVMLRSSIVPEAVIGDLDSIKPAILSQLHDSSTAVVEVADQNTNDFEKALLYMADRQIHSVCVLGLAGWRLDHTLANLSVLLRYTPRFDWLHAIDDTSEHYFITAAHTPDVQVGDSVSLTPFGEARAIETTNLQYALRSEDLVLGRREGLSNVVTGLPVTISLNSGSLLISITRSTK